MIDGPIIMGIVRWTLSVGLEVDSDSDRGSTDAVTCDFQWNVLVGRWDFSLCGRQRWIEGD